MEASQDKLARTLAGLSTALSSGDYYGALQMYRTLVKRKLDGGRLGDACTMVTQGANALVASGHPVEAADLVDMLVKCFETSSEVLDETNLGRLCQAAAVFPLASAPACAALAPVLRAGARWAASAPLRLGAEPLGAGGEEGEADSAARRALAGRLHAAAAAACQGAGLQFYEDAQRHYLESSQPQAFGAFLHAWACAGYSSEADLFLARAALKLLVMGRLGEANAVRDALGAEAEAKKGEKGGAEVLAALDSPLAHFVKFLLLTCERDAGPLFTHLCNKYAPSTARDPTFAPHLTVIGQRFFAIAPPRGGMDKMMEGMLGMLGGGGGGGMGGGGGGGGNPLAALMGSLGGAGGGNPQAALAALMGGMGGGRK